MVKNFGSNKVRRTVFGHLTDTQTQLFLSQTDYFILFWTNIALQAIVVLMSVSAIYLLFRKKMRHHSAYFMNFLANSTLIFSEVETQRMVDEDELNDSDFAPSDSE